MSLMRKLAQHAIETHPTQATTVLERLDQTKVIGALERGSVASAATIVERLSPQFATAVVSGARPAVAARILEALPADAATRVVRRLDPDLQEALLEQIDAARARSIRSTLHFREGSAGALMDPDVLALPGELSVRDALRRLRKAPELARYNLYVVDETQRLVGAVNLRELMLARGSHLLVDVMARDPHRVVATADQATVIGHPGWRSVHALPVVDFADAFLGAIRYRVLRRLEEDLLAARSQDADTAAAFGQVISAGARGLIDALSGAIEGDVGRAGRGAG
ncbi:MAG: CBS domain-containing protein [Myxococcales bacterium]|nr:CBS domain-containing protein [Myxococcales bacterium]